MTQEGPTLENIFISHIHEEAPLAKALKEELEATTAGQWQVFVSSDSANITLGDQWFSKIDAALGGHRLLLALCSPASMQRLWIGHEVGYAAAKGVPIIPICHSGLEINALPSFLSRYQGVSIDAPGFVSQLFEAIQKHIPLPRSPRIAEQEIANAIKKALAEIPKPLETKHSEPSFLDDDRLDNDGCTQILTLLAHGDYDWVNNDDLLAKMNVPRARVYYYVNVLTERGLMASAHNDFTGTTYYLTQQGTAYVVEKGIV